MTPAERLAILTTPVAELGAARDQTAADAWRRWGRGNQWTDPKAQPRIGLTMKAWSWPIWRADQATTRIRVWRSPAVYDEPARWSSIASSQWPVLLPWAPGWRPAWEGEDGGCLIDDDATAVEGWEILGLRQAGWLDLFALAFRTGFQARAGDWICDQLVRRTRSNTGVIQGRGSGAIPKRVGIVTAEEVLSGDIGHAMAITGISQYGPGARFVAPATRVEHPGVPPKSYPPAATPADPRLVPHGTRFALAVTDGEIDRWVRTRGHQGATAQTARTLVRAMRTWGVAMIETGTGDPQLECSGLVNPSEASLWRSLGVTDSNAVTLLDGLPWDRLYVVAVPG